ncbi:MAG: MarC family protein [Desulfotomaculaceae bacterium]|jgi:multiple antibiotic resistance protein
MLAEIGITNNELIAYLVLGLGPIRIGLAWMRVARDLNFREQIQVSLRVFWVGVVIVASIMALGFITIPRIAPESEFLSIGAGIVIIVSSLTFRTPRESVAEKRSPLQKALRIAIYPLAVPTMINAVGLGLLMLVAAYIRDFETYLNFFGIVILVFLLNFGVMLLLGRFYKAPSQAVMQLIREIFAILLVALGAHIILSALSFLDVINLTTG